ncbi:MAG: 2-dehydropantoate 2-reductase [Rhodospirillaceae bacterium]|nr:2-dehydropantoate 2-reductase [Rhodospirillaceae bacterium]
MTRIAMMGSGAVGGYFGGRMAAAGCDVTFIARGAHLAAIRQHGLRIESPALGDAWIHPAMATDNPDHVGVMDYVIVCVKLWDTAAAAEAMRPMVGPGTTILSLQNGVETDDLERVFGSRCMLGASAYIGSAIGAPGVIRHVGAMQRVVTGERGGGSSDRVERLLAALRRGGVDADASDNIQRTIWEKFVFLVGLSSATTLFRAPLGWAREDPKAREVLLDAMRETAAVARALGIALEPGFARGRLEFADGLPAEMTSSMHSDLEQGNRLELEWLSGAVVRFGRKAGIQTSANDNVYEALLPYASGCSGGMPLAR